jgi:ubiquinone/menaquinone biosynthesis C-methylase UbiE
MPDAPRRDARRYYDDFSPTYDQGRTSDYHRMIDDLEIRVAEPYARGARVLELGCGTGLILSRLAEVAEEAVGIDLSEGMAARAKARGLDVRIGDIRALPFEDGAFDLTCSFKVLPHVPEVEAAIREAVRVTRPGGHLVLELYNPWSLRYVAAAGKPRRAFSRGGIHLGQSPRSYPPAPKSWIATGSASSPRLQASTASHGLEGLCAARRHSLPTRHFGTLEGSSS